MPKPKGLKDVYSGACGMTENLLGTPKFAKNMMVAMLVVGGVILLVLIAGISWGIGSGKQDMSAMVAEGVKAGKMMAI